MIHLNSRQKVKKSTFLKDFFYLYPQKKKTYILINYFVFKLYVLTRVEYFTSSFSQSKIICQNHRKQRFTNSQAAWRERGSGRGRRARVVKAEQPARRTARFQAAVRRAPGRPSGRRSTASLHRGGYCGAAHLAAPRPGIRWVPPVSACFSLSFSPSGLILLRALTPVPSFRPLPLFTAFLRRPLTTAPAGV